MQALIAELAAQGLSVVLISSELEELLEGADRVVVLKDGAVVGLLAGSAITEDGLMALLSGAPGQDDAALAQPAATPVDSRSAKAVHG